MAEQNTKLLEYDAFISYRHCELDSFVAERLHQELEKFKLPTNLTKQRQVLGEKTKISRVFRDRDELPISSDLSESIQSALKVSDYLIVICTPRLKESMWCMNEIDTFIKLHGREHVLAVLAEGEPVDSFPEAITKSVTVEIDENGVEHEVVTYIEPLAADVRGENRKEIAKKIREEVLRLAAPIFNCAYDEIKQRHREQKLRRRIRIASGIAAVCLVFGAVATIQALRISNQAKMINEQYATIQTQYGEIQEQYKEIESQKNEIEAQKDEISNQYDQIQVQYQENLEKQGTIINNEAQRLLSEGKVEDALSEVISYTDQFQEDLKLSGISQNQMMYTLADLLRVYDNGANLRPERNLVLDSRVKQMISSDDRSFFAVFDTNGGLKIWNTEDLELVYEMDTEFDSSNEYAQNAYFDLSNNFVFLGRNTITSINCAEKKENFTTELSSKSLRFIIFNKDQQLLVQMTEGTCFVNSQNGEIVKEEGYGDDVRYLNTNRILISADKKTAYYVMSNPNENYTLMSIALDTLKVKKSANINHEFVHNGIVLSDGTLAYNTMDFDLDTGLSGLEYQWVCIDPATMKEKWTRKSEHLYTQLYSFDDYILAYYSGGIEYLDNKTLKTKDECQMEAVITDLGLNSNGNLILLLSNGAIRFQDGDKLNFSAIGNYNIKDEAISDMKFAGSYYAVVRRNAKNITLYSKKVSGDLSEFEYNKDNDPSNRQTLGKACEFAEGKTIKLETELNQIVLYEDGKETKSYSVNAASVSGVCADESADLLFVSYSDASLEIRKLSDYTLLTTVTDLGSSVFYEKLNDEMYVIGDALNSTIYDVETNMPIVDVPGYVYYDEADNSFVTKYNEQYYRAPFADLESLLAKAKEYVQ